ncbi:hypothetical protein GCM10018785_61410 [Streptomyces longispororuber]|uniref:Uncharacterized protein n=1 Tax=Streptomyces longispororuber TaxID=68230 RepID=A0A919A5T8_9ACTN|nr:hypothetical protein [Streptomyces longispororuber]GHE85244.1 hypothetical protein GCM10018785_61410 [Streptomyces longispororuber]
MREHLKAVGVATLAAAALCAGYAGATAKAAAGGGGAVTRVVAAGEYVCDAWTRIPHA